MKDGFGKKFEHGASRCELENMIYVCEKQKEEDGQNINHNTTKQ